MRLEDLGEDCGEQIAASPEPEAKPEPKPRRKGAAIQPRQTPLPPAPGRRRSPGPAPTFRATPRVRAGFRLDGPESPSDSGPFPELGQARLRRGKKICAPRAIPANGRSAPPSWPTGPAQGAP